MATVYTDAGKALTAARMVDSESADEPKYIGWGTGSGTAAVTDTTLFTEAGTRVAGTGSVVTTDVTGDTHQVTGTLTATGSETITNAGVFDASTAGNLYLKGDFTGVALEDGDSIAFTMQVQYTDAA